MNFKYSVTVNPHQQWSVESIIVSSSLQMKAYAFRGYVIV